MEQGWDPEVKNFFRKILNSISYFLLWLMLMVTAGLYFQMAYDHGQPRIHIILFYVVMIVTLLLLIRYYYRIWK